MFLCLFLRKTQPLGQILKHSEEWRESSGQESGRTEPRLCAQGVAPASAGKVVTKPSLARHGLLAPVQEVRFTSVSHSACPTFGDLAPLSMGFSK